MGKTVYRVGDRVTIADPQLFVRVGYPMTFDRALEYVVENHQNEVLEFCQKFEVSDACVRNMADSKLFHDIMNALASQYMRENHFGGTERSIYNKIEDELKNTGPWIVTKKRTVKTGIYQEGFTDWEGDYTLPFLSPEKSNILLTLEPDFVTQYLWYPFEIQEVFVKPLKVDK